MPNVITHGLMAQDVIQVLSENQVSLAIEKYPQCYFVGSNGPDYLFYYRFLSSDEDAKAIRQIGSIFHAGYINEFYQSALNFLEVIKDQPEDYQMLLSYLAGHLCHWALDSLAHPYIFHKTGKLEGASRYYHFRFESMIDNLMVTQIKKESLKNFPTYKFAKLDPKEKNIIAKGYQYITRQVLKRNIERKKFIKALSQMGLYTKFLFDPKGLVIKPVQLFEKKVLKDPWFLSSHLVSKESDLERDILNLKRDVWSHPSHADKKYTVSFVDLYHESMLRAQEVLEYLIKLDSNGLVEYLADRDYETGLSENKEMNNFNIIY